VVVDAPTLPDLNFKPVKILEDELEPRLFTVIDDAVFYLKDDEDTMFIKLPSVTAPGGYREEIEVEMSDIGIDVDDITVLYVLKSGAYGLVAGVAGMVLALGSLIL
jgi:hypothetical protein